ncbi:ankyrin repeat domain-containing protein 50-like [Ptychodera flava]|uniref:ankyrin repeat domain-containing protein 50-like n=1 Tax=Ptychodera flava TaxID=63121 RepID=UPI00396A5204
MNGYLQVAKTLCEKGVDKNAIDKDNRTAIHLAAAEGKFILIEYLCDIGININATDKDNRNALHLAAINGHLQVAKTLREKGVDMNAIDKDNRTALHLAAMEGKFIVTEYLCDIGIDICATDKDNRNALHLAALNGHPRIASVLCEKGMNMNAVDKDNNDALNLASREGHSQVVRTLLEANQRGYNAVSIPSVTTPQGIAMPQAMDFGHHQRRNNGSVVPGDHLISRGMTDQPQVLPSAYTQISAISGTIPPRDNVSLGRQQLHNQQVQPSFMQNIVSGFTMSPTLTYWPSTVPSLNSGTQSVQTRARAELAPIGIFQVQTVQHADIHTGVAIQSGTSFQSPPNLSSTPVLQPQPRTHDTGVAMPQASSLQGSHNQHPSLVPLPAQSFMPSTNNPNTTTTPLSAEEIANVISFPQSVPQTKRLHDGSSKAMTPTTSAFTNNIPSMNTGNLGGKRQRLDEVISDTATNRNKEYDETDPGNTHHRDIVITLSKSDTL